MKNYNSSENQDIKSKFVGREVIHNLGQTMSEYEVNNPDELMELAYSTIDIDGLKESILNYSDDDLINTFKYMHPIMDIDDLIPGKAKINAVKYWLENEVDEDELIEIADYLHEEPIRMEPYEFWAVSNWLGDKLIEKGEIVFDCLDFTVWGRCTTGQAILLDHVISEICDDLNMLV